MVTTGHCITAARITRLGLTPALPLRVTPWRASLHTSPCHTRLRGEEEPGWWRSVEVYVGSRTSGRPDSEARGSPGAAETAGRQAQQRVLSPGRAAGASPGGKSTQARGRRLQDCTLKSEHATAGLDVVSDPADASSFLQTSREHLRRRARAEAADGKLALYGRRWRWKCQKELCVSPLSDGPQETSLRVYAIQARPC